MDIKEIAIRISGDFGIAVRDKSIGDFSEAIISAYKAELLKDVGEPVGTFWYEEEDDGLRHEYGVCLRTGAKIDNCDKLYTESQLLAAAIAKETKPLEERRCEVCGYAEHHREHTGCLRKQIEKLTAERDAALARLSEERDIWDGMLGDAADKFAHLEREIDDCLYVLDALWDKQCNKIVTQKWAEILIRNKRDIGALSAGDSCQQSTE